MLIRPSSLQVRARRGESQRPPDRRRARSACCAGLRLRGRMGRRLRTALDGSRPRRHQESEGRMMESDERIARALRDLRPVESKPRKREYILMLIALVLAAMW